MLFFNELSLHGQFHTHEEAESSFLHLLAMRELAMRFNISMQVSQLLSQRQIIGETSCRAVIARFSKETQRAVALWLDRTGPFWDEGERHSADDYLECGTEIVTDTGLGEAAVRRMANQVAVACGTRPSNWTTSPLAVSHVTGDARRVTEVDNFCDTGELGSWLNTVEPPPTSWTELVAWGQRHCHRLRFAPDVVHELQRHPFLPGASERLQVLLTILQRVAESADAAGQLGPVGQELMQQHFVGEKALFSDSSASEKSDFGAELTFQHPEDPSRSIFATWHGKVKIGQLRVHYDHTFRADQPVYVLYIGPKLTKR